MQIKTVRVENPDGLNFILGQTHFIKTAEDVHEALVNAVPAIKFGVAFCEASGPCLVRLEGNDKALKDLASRNALAIGAGHSFMVFMKDAFPVNVLKAVQGTPEVVNIFCATANPVEVIIAEGEEGRGILGVIDGFTTKGVEGEKERRERIDFLRKIGYKLG